ncbi:MAG: tagaturonate epimerase family protein [bacterium]
MEEWLNTLVAPARVYSDSISGMEGGIAAMVRAGDDDVVSAVCAVGKAPAWHSGFDGDRLKTGEIRVTYARYSEKNASHLRNTVPWLKPRPIGLKPSFGFGDRTGLATPGHAAAAADYRDRIVPVFQQQSMREMSRTHRTPAEVMNDAAWGLFRAGWDTPFCADADHLKTAEDVDAAAGAGFVFFTIDPSDHVDAGADDCDAGGVNAAFEKLVGDGVEGAGDVLKLYSGARYRIESSHEAFEITFDELPLKRAAVKYARAIAHAVEMSERIARAMGGSAFEMELSVDETARSTSVLEHLFIGLELKRRGVRVVSLAPRFVGGFEKGVDYKGDLTRFRADLRRHAAVARFCGPYKIGVHSGSDKLSVYPALGEECSGLFHVKTAGTSYLEALRVAARADAALFREIIAFSRERFDADRASYHVSSRLDRVAPPGRLGDEDLESVYLDGDDGRQVLHVAFGSVLTAGSGGSYVFRDRLKSVLRRSDALHVEILKRHFRRHLDALTRRAGGGF